MSVTTMSYYASNYLLANTNRTQLAGADANGNLTNWLKDAYNANIGTSTDIYDLLAQLKSNSAFNPFDAIDDYVLNIENSPLGNMVNEATDAHMNEYHMYTLGSEIVGSTTGQVINTGNANHDGYDSTATVNGKDVFFCNASDQAIYIALMGSNPGQISYGTSVTYFEKNGTTYDLKALSRSITESDYAEGVKIGDSEGYISPYNKDLTTEVTSFVNNGGTVNLKGTDVAVNAANKDQLVAMYKQLVSEMQGLKEYTMTNQEILDLQSEITNLTSDGVQGNLQRKIAKAQDELKDVLGAQVAKLKQGGVVGIAGIFKTTEIANMATGGGSVIKKAAQVGKLISIADALNGPESYGNVGKFKYNGSYYNATDDVVVTLPPSSGTSNSMGQLFREDATTGQYDYVNNPFYQYEVALRTDSDLTFEKSFAQFLPNWTTPEKDIAKGTPTNFDPSKYSNVKDKDPQLGAIDVLKGLYNTQELLALYKQYEESQNKANSMTLGLNVALQNSAEFDFRKALADQILTKLKGIDPMVTVELSADIYKNGNTQRGCSTGPSAMKTSGSVVPTFDGFYGDVKSKKKVVDNTPKKIVNGTSGSVLVDPYVVTINGVKYIMGKDGDANGNIDDVSEILGINDSQDNPFASLISLDTNNDGKVSQEELLMNGIVLKAVDAAGKLSTSSYDTSLISGIDLSKIDKTKTGNTYGSFDVKLTNGSIANGILTFDDQSYFNNLFGGLVDLSKYQKAASATSTTNSTSNTTSTSTAATTAATTAASTTSSNEVSHQKLLNQLNSAYSSIVIDDTSKIETIMNSVCWKHSITLTSAQRLKILNSIDPMLTPYEVEKKIVNAVSQLNLSA